MTDWLRILNHPLSNPAFFMIARQLTKGIDFEQPANLQAVRILYLVSQAIIIGLTYFLIARVRSKNDTTPLQYVIPKQQSWDGTESPDELVETTNAEYDVKEIEKSLKQAFTAIAIMAFLHLQFKYVQPMLVQSIVGFKTFFTTKEARIHFFNGNTSTGDLKRPFRQEAPFGMIPESKQPQTDKGSIKKARKARKAE